MKKEDEVDLDDVREIGEFKKYQKLLFWFICLPACVPCSFAAFNQLFMAETPGHWCRIPELDHLSVDERKELGIPQAGLNGSFSKCQRYRVNWTEVMSNYSTGRGPFIPDTNWDVEPCLDGWEYDDSVLSSIVIDFDLVCDRDIFPTLGLTFLNIGGPIGVYSFGILNDRCGRKISYFACLTMLIVGGLMTALSFDFWTWATSRFFVGLTVPAMYQIPFIIALELVGPSYRTFVTVFTCLGYTLGLVILAGLAYMVPNWRTMALYTSVPFLAYFFHWFFLPESPRWLLARGRFDEAYRTLEKIAETNGTPLQPQLKLKLKKKYLNKTKSEELVMEKGTKISALCASPNMRLKTFLITLNWFANEMVYVGLSYYAPALGENEHLSFFLGAIVEIPSYLSCWAVMDRCGRRWPLALCMIISGISCSVTVLLPEDATTTTLVLYLISKFTIAASFLIIYPFAGELYPTQIRGIGIGTSSYVGGLGLIIIPFIIYLGKDNLSLPLLIMGIVSVIGGFCCFRLPETLHQPLPQTLEEGENFGKDWSFKDCLSCVKQDMKNESASYYDLTSIGNEPETPSSGLGRRTSRLIRQSSVMETSKDSSGAMQMTYWF